MKLLMFSGGLDSTVLFYDLISKSEAFRCCYISYGQKNAMRELEVVRKVCNRNMISLTVLDMHNLFQGSKSALLVRNTAPHTVQTDEVRNRNATLACVAAANIDGEYTILFAAHKTSAGYADATPAFYSRLSKLLYLSTNNRVDCEAPYIRLTKKQIVKRAWDLALTKKDIAETVSCYVGNNCGTCPACLARERALKGIFIE